MKEKILQTGLTAFSYIAVPALQKFRRLVHIIGLAGMGYGYGFDEQIHAKEYVYKKSGYGQKDSKTFVFFDVGANYGQTIQRVVKLAKDNYMIYAFEPQKSCLTMLHEQFATDQVQVFGIGLGSEKSTVELHKNVEGSGTASIYDFEKNSGDVTETIEITTLDNFAVDNHIDYISYLKIDVEGAEYSVLAGAKNLLSTKKIEAIEFEFFKQNLISKTSFKDFWDLLSEDYSFYRILPHHVYRIESYHHLLEVYVVSNILCIRKDIA